jgi:hypothetical protein
MSALIGVVPWYTYSHAKMLSIRLFDLLPGSELVGMTLGLCIIATVVNVDGIIENYKGFHDNSHVLMVLRVLIIGVLGGCWVFTIYALYNLVRRVIAVARDHWRDRRLFRASAVIDPIARPAIVRELAGYTTPKYRLRYVRRLVLQNPEVKGEWPGGALRSDANDSASIILAQWEERLRRLD